MTVNVSGVPAVSVVGKPVTFERLGGGGLDDDVLLGADDGRIRGIGRRDRLGAGGLERDGERVRAGVGGGEGVIRRQDGLRIGAGELDRADVAGVGAAVRDSGAVTVKVSEVPAVLTAGMPVMLRRSVEPGPVSRIGLDERVGGLAVDAVAVLVHVIAVPVLDVGADRQRVGAGGGLGGERDVRTRGRSSRRPRVTVTPLIDAAGAGEGDLRRR